MNKELLTTIWNRCWWLFYYKNYIKNPPYLLGLSVNAFLNLQLQCCGKNSYEDWFSTPWERTVNTTSGVPHSCCRIPDTSCNNMNVNANSTYIYQQVIHLYQAIYFKSLLIFFFNCSYYFLEMWNLNYIILLIFDFINFFSLLWQFHPVLLLILNSWYTLKVCL